MKKSIIAIAMLVLIGSWSSASAQDNITMITYQPSVAVGDLEDFIGETSWIGWGLEGRRFRDPTSKLTMGFSFAWNVFDERFTGTTDFDQGAVTGTQRRWVNSLPFLITGDYYLNRKSGFKPYVGVGAGAYYIVQRIDIGVFKREVTNWHFGVEGEAGFQFPLGDIEGVVAARYNYAFAAGDALYGDPVDITYVSAIVGLAYTRW
jgi:hypothetical protein